MKMMVVAIVVGAFVTTAQGWVKRLKDLEISGQVETIQTAALLRSVRILKRVLQT